MAKGKKTGGRVRGTSNKLTSSVKEMVLSALDDVGGIEYLKTQSIDNPVAFLTLVGKVLPLTLGNDKDSPIFPSSVKFELINAPSNTKGV